MIAICIPFYFCADPQRWEITRKAFHHYAKVAAQIDAVVVGLGSEGSLSRSLWCRYFPAETYFEYDQSRWPEPPDAGGCVGLSHKFNCALDAARQFEPTHYAIVGSDDIITAEYFAAARDSGADMVGVANGPDGGAYLYDCQTARALWWDGLFVERWRHLPFCAGTFVWTERALERAKWQPWSWGPHEGHLIERFREQGVSEQGLAMRRDGFAYWMVKGEKVLNSVERMERAGFHIEPADAKATEAFLDYWSGL